jgi:trans-2,3-dihydro-3-hydroxyanthranilate isomerase
MPGPIGFHHVDVFTPRPYSGNSLAVFPDAAGLTGGQMARITKELRHFESIFSNGTAAGRRAGPGSSI